jgi:hypothetical protein
MVLGVVVLRKRYREAAVIVVLEEEALQLQQITTVLAQLQIQAQVDQVALVLEGAEIEPAEMAAQA